jgi:hypothetical protein
MHFLLGAAFFLGSAMASTPEQFDPAVGWARIVAAMDLELITAPDRATVDATALAALTPSDATAAAAFEACRAGTFVQDRDSAEEHRYMAMVRDYHCAAAIDGFDHEATVQAFLAALTPRAVYVSEERFAQTMEASAVAESDPRLSSVMQGDRLILTLNAFDPGATARVAAILRGASRAPGGWGSTTIDLRNNVGGELQEVASMLDLFVADGGLFSIRGRRRSDVERFRATARTSPAETLPLNVLIDETTENGAEIFAHVLRQRRQAVLLGQPTKGTADIRTAMLLTPTSILLLPTHRIEDNSGVALDNRPVSPDRLLTEADGDWIGVAALPPAATPAPPRR